MIKLLILNLGSTSFKFKLYEYEKELNQIGTGEVSNISGSISDFKIEYSDKLDSKQIKCENHFLAFTLCIDYIKDLGLLNDFSELKAICYKAVHGGKLSGTQVVNDELLSIMKQMVPLAPKHNPVYIELMEAIKNSYPDLLQLAHFETAFHANMPLYRAAYGVSYKWLEEYGIRRYGFHGSSHEYISLRMKELDKDVKKLISVHLGGSCSVCAIDDGKSIASSMGATPQSGLFQNNRVGDLDSFAIPVLADKLGSYDAVYKELSNNSGLKGLSGISNDMREVIEQMNNGNAQAKLTIEAFVDNIVGYIGMFTAYLGGLDAIAFTGGIGTRSSQIRKMVVEKLGFYNVRIDDKLNEENNKQDHIVSSSDSKVKVYAITTNEELVLANETIKYLNI